ncbi:MAG: SUMF1/EgtB/PvdO family nonheme iron enzyme [Candidatus Pacebacteria bacterium]|nr:SUMF1/EgtB/PvdO family nonheme iron enzyme [Candidatus Paceibacterota bacterium]
MDHEASGTSFSLNRDELPHAVQFLAEGGRTGKLDVFVPADDRTGCLFFDGGRLCYAKYRRWEGIEALAQLCLRDNLEAHFVPDARAGDCNLDEASIASILVQAAARADELEDAPLVPGAGYGATEGSFLDGAVAADDDPLAFCRRCLAPVSRVAVCVCVFAVFFLTTLYGYQWYLNSESEKAAQKVRDFRVKSLYELSRRRRARIRGLIREGVIAYSRKEYTKAEQYAVDILEMSPKHERALELQQRAAVAQALLSATSVRGEAEAKLAALQDLSDEQFITGETRQIDALYQSANSLYDAEQYPQAETKYRTAIARATSLVARADQHRLAEAKLVELGIAREAAMTAEAEIHAPPLWRSADGLEQAGKDAFAAGAYGEALQSWEVATVQYKKAAEQSNTRQAARVAEREYKDLLAGVTVGTLEEYGGAKWEKTKALAESAVQLVSKGAFQDAERAWSRAVAELKSVTEYAEKRRGRARFEAAVTEGREALESRQWALAERRYRDALAIPGYESDKAAEEGLRISQFENALARASAAGASNDWMVAKREAQRALTIQPGSRRVQDLLEKAERELVPRLTIRVDIEGKETVDARVSINGADQADRVPCTVPLKLHETYTITVHRPPSGNTYYQPFRLNYVVKHPGRQELTASLRPWGPPTQGLPWRVPGSDLEFVPVAPGDFVMGSLQGRADERPRHRVSLTDAFWVGVHEVTNAAYRRYLESEGGSLPGYGTATYLQHFRKNSAMSAKDDFPVCYVNREHAKAFCRWLTRRERDGGRLPHGYVYRLPTEAEWEYCVRAGRAEEDTAARDNYAWFAKNSGHHTQPVGRLAANPWGIHDIQGNVWEWCSDWYGSYSPEAKVDPTGPDTGVLGVVRGGSWRNAGNLCGFAYRNSVSARDTTPDIGFRVVLAPVLSENR